MSEYGLFSHCSVLFLAKLKFFFVCSALVGFSEKSFSVEFLLAAAIEQENMGRGGRCDMML